MACLRGEGDPVSWFRRSSKSANRCDIDEEWQGSFIGRRWCRTHEVRWDDGGRCPHEGQQLRQSTLQVGAILTLQVDGQSRDFSIQHITYDNGAIAVVLQDVESLMRRNTYWP